LFALFYFFIRESQSKEAAFLVDKKNNSLERNFSGFEATNTIQPLREFGIAGATINVPNYPASSEHNFIALALPYIVYRGEIFESAMAVEYVQYLLKKMILK